MIEKEKEEKRGRKKSSTSTNRNGNAGLGSISPDPEVGKQKKLIELGRREASTIWGCPGDVCHP